MIGVKRSIQYNALMRKNNTTNAIVRRIFKDCWGKIEMIGVKRIIQYNVLISTVENNNMAYI